MTGSSEVVAEWAPMNRWLAMTPALADVDLRDYMWVTRDRLGSTMSGTTMVPAIVRTMLKQLLSDLGDTAARKAIPQLQPAERSILAHQLISQAQRTPGNVKAFQALMEIAELDEPIAEDFKAVVMRIQKTDLAPALAIHIVTTSKKQNALGKVCQAIVVSGQDGRTPFEKSLKQKPR